MHWRQSGKIPQTGIANILMIRCLTQYTVFMAEQLRNI